MGVIIASLVFFPSKRRMNRESVFLYILPFYFILHTFWIQWNPYSMNVSTRWLLISLGSAAFVQLSSGFVKGDKKVIFNAVSIGVTIQSIWVLCQYFGVQPLHEIFQLFGWTLHHDNLNNGLVGSITQQTLSGASIAISMPVLFRRRWIFLLPISLIAAYLTLSAMTFVAAICATYVCIIYTYVYKPYKILIITALIGLMSFIFYVLSPDLFDGTFFDNQLRLQIWIDSFEFLESAKTLLGGGVGNYADLFRQFRHRIPGWDHPHNEYIWFYMCFGITGCLLAVYSVYSLAKLKVKDPILMASFAAVAANAVGNFTLHVAPIAMVFIVFLSLYVSDNSENIC